MKLKEYLAKNDLTLKDFCMIIDYNETYVCAVAKGIKRPGKKLMRRIKVYTNDQVRLPDPSRSPYIAAI